MSSGRMARMKAEIAGGEKPKQRPLRRRIRDTQRLLSRVSELYHDNS
jgi:hypothetical protein